MTAVDDTTATIDPAIEHVRTSYNRLRGRLFAAIEATGLPDKQEAALKSVVRTLTYDGQATLESILRGGNE